MRKTKIICTLGPSTDQEGVLRELVANGMNVARFNFSHGSHEEHLGRFEKLKAIREELGKPVAALLDTKGPEIRLKDFKNGTEMLEAGQTFTLTTREVEGTKEICSITYKDLPQDVQPGGTIMLDDGLIKLQIITVNDTDIVCKVLNNGKIKNKKGVNVPGVHLSMPYMSQRDRDDIIFGAQQGFDFIAASFVRTAQDVSQWNPLNSTSLPTMGFNGISVALLASSNPIGTIFSAIFISHISVGGSFLSTKYYPTEISDLISGIIIYLCAFSMLFRGKIHALLFKNADKTNVNAEPAAPAKSATEKEGK